MRTLFAMILIAASVLATPALAAMSAVNPALMHNQDKRPNKVVLPPPQVFVYQTMAASVRLQ
ncbi:MAG: hypothetical protein WBZ31_12815 [Thiobacillus sp.]